MSDFLDDVEELLCAPFDFILWVKSGGLYIFKMSFDVKGIPFSYETATDHF